jgi:type I restriction enzyme S subunit
MTNDKNAVDALNIFIESALINYVPDHFISPDPALANSTGFFRPFSPRDEVFVANLLGIFEREVMPFAELHEAGRDDVINEVFSRFMSTSFIDEKEMGQYLTPPQIVQLIVELGVSLASTALKRGGLILDPSCGVASFLSAAIRTLHAGNYDPGASEETSRWMKTLLERRVVGIDKSERMTRLAILGLSLFGSRSVNIHRANALSRTGEDGELTNSLNGRVGLILTNPPFGATYKGDSTSGYEIIGQSGRGESEVMFLERYLQWLAPGGVVVSVVPDSVLVNKGCFSDLRQWLYSRCEIEAVISLPPTAFAASGTSVKTSVLALRKIAEGSRENVETFFGLADQIGFTVSTRGGNRRRVNTPTNDLLEILSAFESHATTSNCCFRQLRLTDTRWDAPYQIGLPSKFAAFEGNSGNYVKVSEVAKLIDERCDPRHGNGMRFRYIEISDIDLRTGMVDSKELLASEAPSRARKRVKSGDVLVSTVRPERGTIGIVPKELDGAICSTGLAVLRCTGIDPVALAWLLKTEAVRHQMVKQNIGIAYPAIAEETCMELLLPVKHDDIRSLGGLTVPFTKAQEEFTRALRDLEIHVASLGM